MTTTGRVVFTGDWSWWEIVSRDEIQIDDYGLDAESQAAASIADMDEADPETWVAQVTDVAERHSAIRVGDYAVCVSGVGGDVVFVRLDS